MRNNALVFTVLIIILIMISSNLQYSVESQPSWKPREASAKAGAVKVIFLHKQPIYIVRYAGDKEYSGYVVKFKRLIEYRDLDGDLVFDPTDALISHAILITKGFWNIYVEEFSIDGSIGLKIILEAFLLVSGKHQRGAPKRVRVLITNYLFEGLANIGGYLVNGSTEIKIDITVENWPWAVEDSYLALEVEIGCERNYTSIRRYHRHTIREKKKFHETIVSASGVPYNLSFWINNDVRIDNKTKEILSINAVEENLYITYPRFKNLLKHDPIISISRIRETFYKLISIEKKVLGAYIGVALVLTFAVLYKIRRSMTKYLKS